MSVVQLNALLHVLSSNFDDQDADFIQHYVEKILTIIKNQKYSEPASEQFVLATKCLINLSSDSSRIEMIREALKTEHDHIDFIQSTVKLIETGSKLRQLDQQLVIDLISNLTRNHAWSSLYSEICGQQIMDIIFDPSRDLCDFLPVLLNLTTQNSIRNQICMSEYVKEIVTLLLQAPVTSDRILAADCHTCLLSGEYHLLDALLIPLCGPEDSIDSEDRATLPKAVEAVTGNSSVQRQFCHEIILTNCQTLFQFCSTKHGRIFLRSNGVYFVLRELHKFVNGRLDEAKDEESKASYRDLVYHIELVVDQLICEEGDRDERYRDQSLRNIEVESKMADELEKAKQDFMSS